MPEASESQQALIDSLEAQLASFYVPRPAQAGKAVAPVSAPSAAAFISQQTRLLAATMTHAQADLLPHGAIQLDDDGTILIYNRWESQLAGFDPADAEGSIFFTQIAPCTNNRLFFGRFLDGVATNQMDVVFPYTFTYRMSPTLVLVHLLRTEGVNWLFVSKP